MSASGFSTVSLPEAAGPFDCRIAGSGRMAGALADAFSRFGGDTFRLSGMYARDARKARKLTAGSLHSGDFAALPASGAETITLLAVSDSAIPEVAAQLAESGKAGAGLFVHTSGASGLESLSAIRKAGGRCGSFHPLQSFAGGTGAEAFGDISISILCDDISDADLLSALAQRFSARPLKVNAAQKKQLHLAAVMASNYMVALLHLAELSAPAVSGELLPHFRPLLQQTLDNVMQRGTAEALTGPVSRGDIGTLQEHLSELESITAKENRAGTAELISAYKQLGRIAADLAHSDGRLSDAQRRELHERLRSGTKPAN